MPSADGTDVRGRTDGVSGRAAVDAHPPCVRRCDTAWGRCENSPRNQSGDQSGSGGDEGGGGSNGAPTGELV